VGCSQGEPPPALHGIHRPNPRPPLPDGNNIGARSQRLTSSRRTCLLRAESKSSWCRKVPWTTQKLKPSICTSGQHHAGDAPADCGPSFKQPRAPALAMSQAAPAAAAVAHQADMHTRPHPTEQLAVFDPHQATTPTRTKKWGGGIIQVRSTTQHRKQWWHPGLNFRGYTPHAQFKNPTHRISQPVSSNTSARYHFASVHISVKRDCRSRGGCWGSSDGSVMGWHDEMPSWGATSCDRHIEH
jgi:hypothetical protein